MNIATKRAHGIIKVTPRFEHMQRLGGCCQKEYNIGNDMTKEEFRQIRIKLKLSQGKMGQLVGISARSIRRFESGEWPVSKVVRDKLKIVVDGAD